MHESEFRGARELGLRRPVNNRSQVMGRKPKMLLSPALAERSPVFINGPEAHDLLHCTILSIRTIYADQWSPFYDPENAGEYLVSRQIGSLSLSLHKLHGPPEWLRINCTWYGTRPNHRNLELFCPHNLEFIINQAVCVCVCVCV